MFYQGDILKDLTFISGDPQRTSEKDIFELPYAVLLNQACDLNADFKSRKSSHNQDKYLLSLLVCPAFNLEDFSAGTHLSNWEMSTHNNKELDRIKGNDTFKRYHYLVADNELLIPELVLDFKHFFTLPREYLYSRRKDVYVASLSELFREELSQRFSNYLSRIGLPEL